MLGFEPISNAPISDTGAVSLPTATLSGAILERHDSFAAQQTIPIYTIDFTFQPSTFQHAPTTINFTDASFVSPGGVDSKTAWAWDFGDGFTSTLQNPTHQFVQSGFFNVHLTVTWVTGGAKGPATHIITVLPPLPPPGPTPPSPPPIRNIFDYVSLIVPEHKVSAIVPVVPTTVIGFARIVELAEGMSAVEIQPPWLNGIGRESHDFVLVTANVSSVFSGAGKEAHDTVAAQASHS